MRTISEVENPSDIFTASFELRLEVVCFSFLSSESFVQIETNKNHGRKMSSDFRGGNSKISVTVSSS